jgi:hypothetical protein
MKREKVIGSSVPRRESVEKVTGKAVYAVDISLPNMLFGKCCAAHRLWPNQANRYQQGIVHGRSESRRDR